MVAGGKHIYKGVAEAIESDLELAQNAVLKTPWKELDPAAQTCILYGLGDRHITFSYGHRGGTWKHGGTFDGLVAELLEGYRKNQQPDAAQATGKIHDLCLLLDLQRQSPEQPGNSSHADFCRPVLPEER